MILFSRPWCPPPRGSVPQTGHPPAPGRRINRPRPAGRYEVIREAPVIKGRQRRDKTAPLPPRKLTHQHKHRGSRRENIFQEFTSAQVRQISEANRLGCHADGRVHCSLMIPAANPACPSSTQPPAPPRPTRPHPVPRSPFPQKPNTTKPTGKTTFARLPYIHLKKYLLSSGLPTYPAKVDTTSSSNFVALLNAPCLIPKQNPAIRVF